eukprot:TRINITY_DN5137_c0_g1_i6.p1 TRINITY_DN5137_c0_g1~~TRINITY_DN5137_c0_g1_i6.p1  ORF type:complete len:240 (-),score=56.81 TRINITY_DN5137_c0_g1_i6:119-787(-)
MGLEQMHVLGHSLGGYVAAVYAMRHPQRVVSLVLASPVGVPDKQFMENRQSRRMENASWRQKFMYRLVNGAWSLGISPQSIIRCLGPWGPRLIHKFVSWRFADVCPGDPTALSQYLYHTFVHDPSAEHSLYALFDPVAWAKRPLIERMHLIDPSINICWLYGAYDWMTKEPVVKLLQEVEQQPAPRRYMELHVVPDSGHQLYLENPPEFNQAVLKFLQRKRF